MQSNEENVMAYMGDDFAYMNAYHAFQQLDLMVEFCNNITVQKIKCKYSTP